MTRGELYHGLTSGSLQTEADFFAAGIRFSSEGHPPVPKMRVDDLPKTQADALIQKALAEIARRSIRFTGKTGDGGMETLWRDFRLPYNPKAPKAGFCLICGEPRYLNYIGGDCYLCWGAWRMAVKKSGYVAPVRVDIVLAPAAPVITIKPKAPWET